MQMKQGYLFSAVKIKQQCVRLFLAEDWEGGGGVISSLIYSMYSMYSIFDPLAEINLECGDPGVQLFPETSEELVFQKEQKIFVLQETH
jgi:hypothetical protein